MKIYLLTVLFESYRNLSVNRERFLNPKTSIFIISTNWERFLKTFETGFLSVNWNVGKSRLSDLGMNRRDTTIVYELIISVRLLTKPPPSAVTKNKPMKYEFLHFSSTDKSLFDKYASFIINLNGFLNIFITPILLFYKMATFKPVEG